MRRCLELAQNGSGFVAPNPMVGAVLVHEDKIIGEGFHHMYGGPHAEVFAIEDAIRNGNESLLSKSVLFVSLEPCTHQGKTPPCTELIIRYKIPTVIIGSTDPFPEVNGKGIEKLSAAGIKVENGILEDECISLNKRFFTYHTKRRPYIILKYAQTKNHLIAPLPGEEKKISNEVTDRLVHRWRSEEAAILVGTQTAALDNPSLTVRKWKGKNPVRAVLDQHLRLPKNLNLFDSSAPTLVFNSIKSAQENNIEFIRIDFKENVIEEILSVFFERKIISVMVEGGTNLFSQFIGINRWDEARIITSSKSFSGGISAPKISGKEYSKSISTGDEIKVLIPFKS